MGGPVHIHGHTGQKHNLPSRDTQVPHARGSLGAVKAISQGGPAAREGVWGAVSPCLFRLQRPRSHGEVDQPAPSCSPSVLPIQGGGVLTSDQIDSAAAGAWAT